MLKGAQYKLELSLAVSVVCFHSPVTLPASQTSETQVCKIRWWGVTERDERCPQPEPVQLANDPVSSALPTPESPYLFIIDRLGFDFLTESKFKHIKAFFVTRKVWGELLRPTADGEASCGLDGLLRQLRCISRKEVCPVGGLSPPPQPDECCRRRLVNRP